MFNQGTISADVSGGTIFVVAQPSTIRGSCKVPPALSTWPAGLRPGGWAACKAATAFWV